MNTDLLRSLPKWTDTLNDMRTVCQGLKEEGIAGEAVNAWALHWDHQLYKGQMRERERKMILTEVRVEDK